MISYIFDIRSLRVLIAINMFKIYTKMGLIISFGNNQLAKYDWSWFQSSIPKKGAVIL